MKLLSFLLAPALSLAGTFSGTVVSLDGTPIVGATIKVGTDSVTTTPNGSWSLARAVGIAPRSGKAVSVTSHLTLENGRPRLSFGAMDISGRGRTHVSLIGSERSLSGAEGSRTAARSLAAPDTLRLYWKGKRLTVLPVPADTGSITFRIDTAWNHDWGIPWNPRITYGSLFDARDSQTYRTVTIGTQTWMAENLNYAAENGAGICYTNSPCAKYGRLYSWESAMASASSSSKNPSGVKGFCPNGWHVPSDTEWSALQTAASVSDSTEGAKLKSTSGWSGDNGADEFGFRSLPGGYVGVFSFSQAGICGYWWSATEYNASRAWFRSMGSSYASVSRYYTGKSFGHSIRCAQDSP